MFKTFSLFQGTTLYLQNEVSGEGSVVDGVYIPPTIIEVMYTTFTAHVEPYGKSDRTLMLPSGVKSTDVILVYADEDYLLTACDFEGENAANKASRIYLTNPEEDDKAKPYLVYNKKVWRLDKGFSLLSNTYCEYICIREDKL